MVTRPGLCSLTDWKLPRPPDVPPELMGMSVRLPPHPDTRRAFSPCLRLRGDALLPVLDFLSGTPSRSILSNSSVSCFVLQICHSHDPEYPPLDISDLTLFGRQRR